MSKKNCKSYYKFLLPIAVVGLYFLLQSRLISNPALEELNYYIRTNEEQCPSNDDIPVTAVGVNNEEWTEKYFEKPNCKNLLNNLIKGKWAIKKPLDHRLVKEINDVHEKYRNKLDLPMQLWRLDNKCGYNVPKSGLMIAGQRTGSFCNPQSLTPCCSNKDKGVCVPITGQQRCDCPDCVNTRNYKDALVSNWKTEDEGCYWKNYTSLGACAVLNRLSRNKRKAHIHYVGDSLMRNMFMGMNTLLTAERQRGIRKKCLSKELKELCWSENNFLMRPCHDLAVAYSVNDLKNSEILCEGQRYFEAEYNGIGMPSQAQSFIDFLISLKGKENTYVLVGVGLHFHCKAKDVIEQYLDPVIKQLHYSEETWPRLIWVHPLSIGLLKPPAFMNTQGDKAIAEFAQSLEEYLKLYKIPVMDFRGITKEVNSYDGTHYGAGVNMMKAQILLNYLATL